MRPGIRLAAFLLPAWLLATAEPVGVVGGAITAVCTANGDLYAAAGARLLVFGPDPAASSGYSQRGASAPLADSPRGIAVQNGRAFVAAGSAGLRIYDVSQPGDPVELGSAPTPGYAEGVAVRGTLAFVADGPLGLRVVDLSAPERPVEIGWAYEGKQAMAAAVRQQYVFVAAGGAGLLVADVSNPSRPVEVSAVPMYGYATGLALNGDLAYVLNSWGGVGIVDITNPAQPALASTYSTPGWALKASISGTTMAVADAYRGVRVLDLSDPLHPAEVGANETDLGDAVDTVIDGGRVWVADRHDGLRSVTLEPDSKATSLQDTFRGAFSAALSGSYAYVSALEKGLRIIDISDPAHPREVGVYPAGNAVGVTVNYPYVYLSVNLGDDTNGFHVVDVSDPGRPKRVGFIPNRDLPMNTPRDQASVGSMVYVTNEIGLIVIDAADPERPVVSGFAEGLPGSATMGIALRGHYAYVAQEGVGLLVFDIADARAPKLVGKETGETYVQDVALFDNYAFVAGKGRSWIVDVSDPEHPRGLPTRLSGGTGVSTSGSRAYLSQEGAGIQVFDVSNPGSAVAVASYRTPGYARKGFVQGDRLWIADAEAGFWSVPLATLNRTPAAQASAPHAHPAIPPHAARTPARIPVLAARSQAVARARAGSVRSADAGACVVTSVSDTGAGSLRDCIANIGPGGTITFDASAFPPDHPRVIGLQSPLPPITQGNVTIDASSAGAGLSFNGCPGQGEANGLEILSDGNTVRGLAFSCFPGAAILVSGGASRNVIGGSRSQGTGPNGQGNWIHTRGSGIVLSGPGTSRNVVIGNYLNVDPDGIGSSGGGGPCLVIAAGASANRVGGASPDERNIVGACYGGSKSYTPYPTGGDSNLITGPGTTDNVVIGNYFGVNARGDRIQCNFNPNCGVGELTIRDRASRNRIGGTAPGERNVISGSGREGISVGDFGTVDNAIIGNYIGTDATGTRAVPNAVFGIWLDGAASRTRIEGNVISGNQGTAIALMGDYNVVVGNYLGTDPSGKTAVGGGGGVMALTMLTPTRMNRIGGTAPGEANVMAGATSGPEVTIFGAGAENNYVIGNRIGVAAGGEGLPQGAAVGNQPSVWIGDGSKRNVIGGSVDAESNVVAGGGAEGISIMTGASYTFIGHNSIGASPGGAASIANRGDGVALAADRNWVIGNRIAANGGAGVSFGAPSIVRGNSIHGNAGGGIVVYMTSETPAPILANVTATSVTGTACAGCMVDVYSDEGGQGEFFEGAVRASSAGAFTLTKASGFRGPNLTATATSTGGMTSRFSSPVSK